jgi:hypothetical protein
MITHQTPQQILQAATPEQKILWNYIYLTFGENIAISQLYYIGQINATRFTTYSANRLYIIYSGQFSTDFIPNTYSAGRPTLQFCNELNAIYLAANNNNTYWDATAAAPRNMNSILKLENFIFSRIVQSAAIDYQYAILIGYSISI